MLTPRTGQKCRGALQRVPGVNFNAAQNDDYNPSLDAVPPAFSSFFPSSLRLCVLLSSAFVQRAEVARTC